MRALLVVVGTVCVLAAVLLYAWGVYLIVKDIFKREGAGRWWR